eukprot:COSAG01_NODE_2086_length_8456_cov_9.203662_3_plen_164_part_00
MYNILPYHLLEDEYPVLAVSASREHVVFEQDTDNRDPWFGSFGSGDRGQLGFGVHPNRGGQPSLARFLADNDALPFQFDCHPWLHNQYGDKSFYDFNDGGWLACRRPSTLARPSEIELAQEVCNFDETDSDEDIMRDMAEEFDNMFEEARRNDAARHSCADQN